MKVVQAPVAVFHPGTQHSWQTARALQDLGRLEFYATSIAYTPGRWPYWLERLPAPIGPRLGQEFARFAIPGLDRERIRAAGWHEWAERIATRIGFPRLAQRIDALGNRRFVDQLRSAIESDRCFALWGYNNSSLESFALGRSHGRHCILDCTIGDPRALDREMSLLQERYGDWFPGGYRPADQTAVDRADREYALADRILAGCEFAARTIRKEATDPQVAARVEVLDYCYDPLFGTVTPTPPDPAGPVRFLFAGLGIPRKGIHHVLEAIARFPRSQAELTLLGSIGVPPAAFAPYAERVVHLPTVARPDVPAIMARHDVLLFPTYFEGAGLVLYEALAAGLALVQTDRAARAVTPETGIMLERPDSDLLAAAMERIISDREQLSAWRAAAPAAAANYRFSAYRGRIAALLERMAI